MMKLSARCSRTILSVTACTLLSGCIIGQSLKPPSQALQHLPPAQPPLLKAGDRFRYANGRRERIVSVTKGKIDVRRSARYQYQAHADPFLPPIHIQRANSLTRNRIVDLQPTASLWPLEVGKTVAFTQYGSRSDSARESVPLSIKHWRCVVEGVERIEVIAGVFDAYRVECTRKNRRGKIKRTLTHYYAVDIGQIVLRIDRYADKPGSRLELTAFRPDLSMLSSRSRKRFQNRFQQIIEHEPSGTTHSWWSRRHDTRIQVTPTRTFRVSRGNYCRNYLLHIRSEDSIRRGAGLACRDKRGRWRTPDKVDAGAGFRQ